ncbi:MAG TPA: transcriptional repressor [Dehalococcoidia bacterium]|nr:transcriptional repressor [Dehalococcoidia bacterium]
MFDFQSSIQVLRTKGYKLTRPRKRVLEVLAQAQKPVSPYDIQKVLQQRGEHLNHVTIYRILDLFCLLNLAHKVLSFGGFVKCTLGEEEGCHRFMVCRQCGALREFADKALCDEENEIAQDFGFRTEQHFSEGFGLCSNCQGQIF